MQFHMFVFEVPNCPKGSYYVYHLFKMTAFSLREMLLAVRACLSARVINDKYDITTTLVDAIRSSD